jgi:peptide/nickel transport system substrate-binding protein
MSADDRDDAALKAAVGYFKAAGYTFDEAAGKFTAAPEGASLSYEIYLLADGVGDHPSFAILTDARAALATVGLELKISDLSDAAIMMDALNSGTQQLWCAVWQPSIDPDMYQNYHSSGIVGEAVPTPIRPHRGRRAGSTVGGCPQVPRPVYRREVYGSVWTSSWTGPSKSRSTSARTPPSTPGRIDPATFTRT